MQWSHPYDSSSSSQKASEDSSCDESQEIVLDSASGKVISQCNGTHGAAALDVQDKRGMTPLHHTCEFIE